MMLLPDAAGVRLSSLSSFQAHFFCYHFFFFSFLAFSEAFDRSDVGGLALVYGDVTLIFST